MNPAATSKKEILKISRKLIQEENWRAVNIRAVAREGGISVGCVYNYFSSKAQLMEETVESIWQVIFKHSGTEEVSQSLLSFVDWIYDRLEEGNDQYPGFFRLHASILLDEERAEGRKRMMETWDHIHQHLIQVIKHDPQNQPAAFNESFTPENFAQTIFSLILASVMQGSFERQPVKEIIRRCVYSQPV